VPDLEAKVGWAGDWLTDLTGERGDEPVSEDGFLLI
jgi:hypothetical protein